MTTTTPKTTHTPVTCHLAEDGIFELKNTDGTCKALLAGNLAPDAAEAIRVLMGPRVISAVNVSGYCVAVGWIHEEQEGGS